MERDQRSLSQNSARPLRREQTTEEERGEMWGAQPRTYPQTQVARHSLNSGIKESGSSNDIRQFLPSDVATVIPSLRFPWTPRHVSDCAWEENLPSKVRLTLIGPKGVLKRAPRGMTATALSIWSITDTKRVSSLIWN